MPRWVPRPMKYQHLLSEATRNDASRDVGLREEAYYYYNFYY